MNDFSPKAAEVCIWAENIQGVSQIRETTIAVSILSQSISEDDRTFFRFAILDVGIVIDVISEVALEAHEKLKGITTCFRAL